MSALSFAIIGKDQEPLYLREFREVSASSHRESASNFSDEELFGLPLTTPSSPPRIGVEEGPADDGNKHQCSIRQQFILHAALDRFERLAGPPPGYAWRKPGVVGNDAMWVGLLCPVEDMRVYGYMTTTHIKFILTLRDDSVVDDQRTLDEMIKRLFVRLHRFFVEYTLNPFSPLNAPIQSKIFDAKVDECVLTYNRTIT